MSPEERGLLERTLKLSEDNNRMLRKMRRAAKWAIIWGIIKFLIIAASLVIGFLSLEPYLGSLGESLSKAQDLLNTFK